MHMHLHIQLLLHRNMRTNTHRLHTAACGSAAPLAASRKRGRRRGADAEDNVEGMPEEGGRVQIRSRLWLAAQSAGANIQFRNETDRLTKSGRGRQCYLVSLRTLDKESWNNCLILPEFRKAAYCASDARV